MIRILQNAIFITNRATDFQANRQNAFQKIHIVLKREC